MGAPAGMWSLPASEGESATAHFFLGAGDEGLGTRGLGMRPEESDSELLEDEEDEVVRRGHDVTWCWDPRHSGDSIGLRHLLPVFPKA